MIYSFIQLLYLFNNICNEKLKYLTSHYGAKEKARQAASLINDTNKDSLFGFFIMGFFIDKRCFITMFFVAKSEDVTKGMEFIDINYDIFFKVNYENNEPHYIEEPKFNKHPKYIKASQYFTGHILNFSSNTIYNDSITEYFTLFEAESYIRRFYSMKYKDYINWI